MSTFASVANATTDVFWWQGSLPKIEARAKTRTAHLVLLRATSRSTTQKPQRHWPPRSASTSSAHNSPEGLDSEPRHHLRTSRLLGLTASPAR